MLGELCPRALRLLCLCAGRVTMLCSVFECQPYERVEIDGRYPELSTRIRIFRACVWSKNQPDGLFLVFIMSRSVYPPVGIVTEYHGANIRRYQLLELVRRDIRPSTCHGPERFSSSLRSRGERIRLRGKSRNVTEMRKPLKKRH